jgi:Family of unknown function (DUF5670)
MLWITGSLILVTWLITTFVLHKGGMMHTLLIAAISFFIVQFAQDRRTAEYKRSQRGE